MSGKDTSLTYSLYGRDVTASKALKNLGKTAEESGGRFSKMKDVMMGVLSAHMFEKLGSEALKFGKETVQAFDEWGKQVRLTQRIVGGSAEDASKLAFAFKETGLDATQAQMSLKKFAQQVDTNSKTFQSLKIKTKDAHGQTKSFNELLLETADRFKDMPNGIHKTAMAVNLFGRTGLTMLPFLNKGRAGLEELQNEAQKYGLVLNEQNMGVLQDNIKAHREMHAALMGVQVQIGARLTPILTKLMVAFTKIFPILLKYVNPAFKMVSELLKPMINYVKEGIKFIVPLGEHFAKAGSTMSKLKDIGKNLGIVFRAFKELFVTILPVLKALWTFIMKYLAPVLLWLVDVAFKGIAFAAKLVVTSIRYIIDIFKFLINVAKGAGWLIKSVFDFVIGGVKAYINTIIKLIDFVVDIINKIHFKIPSWVPIIGGKEFGVKIPKIPMLAEGGIVNKPTVAMIGEAGPEAVVPLKKGMGSGMTVHVHVAGSVITEKNLALSVRNEIAQLMRRRGADVSILGI